MCIFDILFGWRKASQCKKLAKHARCRLKLLKARRNSMVKYLQQDIAQLINNGQHHIAFSKAEELFRDENLLAAYDLLDHFCEFIINNLSYIRRHRKCTNEIKEAVSTLIFAVAWCGDLPELRRMQMLFRKRYGEKFAKSAIELHPGHHVNNQLKEKLCLRAISDNVKQNLIEELAKEYGIQEKPVEKYEQEHVSHKSKITGIALSEQSTAKTCDSIYTPNCELLYLDEEVEEVCYNVVEEHYEGEKTMFLFSSNIFHRRIKHGASNNPSHVHPKLPDYDEIVAKFKGLKKKYHLQKTAMVNKTELLVQN